MSYAVLFSGQGGQHAGMLPWVSHGPLMDEAQALLGVPDWRLALNDPAWTAANRNAQILLTGVSLTAWGDIAARLPPPAAVAGYSVGELAAFAAAGVFTADEAMRLAAVRAQAMDACATFAPGGLLAVGGLVEADVRRLLHGTGLAVAIRIDATSLVVGGPRAALEPFARTAADRGARCTPLNVTVPSHTPAMQDAAQSFLAELQRLPLARPAVPLIASASGDRVHDVEAARAALAGQIAATVRWSDCTDAVRARRVSCVLEVGGGRALSSGWNRIHPDVPARAADDFRSVEALVDWVHAQA